MKLKLDFSKPDYISASGNDKLAIKFNRRPDGVSLLIPTEDSKGMISVNYTSNVILPKQADFVNTNGYYAIEGLTSFVKVMTLIIFIFSMALWVYSAFPLYMFLSYLNTM